ncbi:efflux RND transporter periplasmic adaptor subunit [Azospirillum brasilense]|nr:efflux RND transporter periplasmic adaptor subunit [Azospirillum brasilense]
MSWLSGFGSFGLGSSRSVILAGLLLLGCEQPTPPPAEATLIRALPVQVSQFDRTAALTGEIQARHESNLGFRVGGKVVERLVDVGQAVTSGQLLARLDNQDQTNAVRSAESDVAAARAAVEQSRTQEERQRSLLANGFTTRVQYDNALKRYQQAQAELNSAEAQLGSARDTLSYTELRADRDGVITAKMAEPGQVVAVGQTVLRLADPGEREAVFQVPGASIRLEGREGLPTAGGRPGAPSCTGARGGRPPPNRGPPGRAGTPPPAGPPAPPPQAPTQIPARRAASTVRSTMRRTAGCSPSACGASTGCSRSIASTYCVRSLVPMEKKDTSRASRSAIITADGTSIMMPSSTRGTSSSRRTASVIALARSNSAGVALIGYMMRTGPSTEARSMARSWVRNRSSRSKHRRMPRTPRKGLPSAGMRR